jgi:predicted nucleic acid-binding protein
MTETRVRELVVDTNVFISSCKGDEPVWKQKRSRAVLNAMYKYRVHWVISGALRDELNHKVDDLLIPNSEKPWLSSWKSNMNTLRLITPVKCVADEALRAEIIVAEGERDHDIHLVEAALATAGPSICSDDDKAGARFCKLTTCPGEELRALQGICWIDLVDEDVEPADVVSGTAKSTEVERLRLSTQHPLYIRVTKRRP